MSQKKRTARELRETIKTMERIVTKLGDEIESSQIAIRQAQMNIKNWQSEIHSSQNQQQRTQGQIEILKEWLTETETQA